MRLHVLMILSLVNIVTNAHSLLRKTNTLPPPPLPVMVAPFKGIDLPEDTEPVLPAPKDDSELNAIDTSDASDDDHIPIPTSSSSKPQSLMKNNYALSTFSSSEFNERRKNAAAAEAEEAEADIQFATKQKKMEDSFEKTLAGLSNLPKMPSKNIQNTIKGLK